MKAEISWKFIIKKKNKSGKNDHTFFQTMIVLGSLEDTLQKSQGVIIVSPQACPQKWRRKTKKKNLLLQNSHKKRSTKALPWNLWSIENLNSLAKISWNQLNTTRETESVKILRFLVKANSYSLLSRKKVQQL